MTVSRPYPFLWLGIWLFGFTVVASGLLGTGPDWLNYDYFFSSLRSNSAQTLAESRFEPGFLALSVFLTEFFSSNLVVFALIAATSVLIKAYAINQFTTRRVAYCLAMAFYLARFAPLHEATQLRIACATSLIFIAVVWAWRGKPYLALAACVTALAFHISVLVVVPFVLFIRTLARSLLKHGRRGLIVPVVAVVACVLFGFDLAVRYLAEFFQVVTSYQEVGFGEQAANPFSASLLLDWAMIIATLLVWKRTSSVMHCVLLLQIVGMVVFYGAIEFPVVAHRLRELFTVFWVFFLVDGMRQEKIIKFMTLSFVIASSFLYSYLYFVYAGFFS